MSSTVGSGVDNSDLEVIDAAINKAKSNDRPTLVKLRTIIGYGATAQGTAGVHGSRELMSTRA